VTIENEFVVRKNT